MHSSREEERRVADPPKFVLDKEAWKWDAEKLVLGQKGIRTMKEVSSRIPRVLRFVEGTQNGLKKVGSAATGFGQPITVWRQVIEFLEGYKEWLRVAPPWGKGTREWLAQQWWAVFGARVPAPKQGGNALLLTGILLELKSRGYAQAKQEYRIPQEVLDGVMWCRKGKPGELKGDSLLLYRQAKKIEKGDWKKELEEEKQKPLISKPIPPTRKEVPARISTIYVHARKQTRKAEKQELKANLAAKKVRKPGGKKGSTEGLVLKSGWWCKKVPIADGDFIYIRRRKAE
jgi:hypothetical protein